VRGRMLRTKVQSEILDLGHAISPAARVSAECANGYPHGSREAPQCAAQC
jgi:hypothetical protein